MKTIIKFIFVLSIGLTGCVFQNTIVEWEDGIIPFFYTGEFSENDIEIIEQAMEEWESVCGVRFELVTPRSNAYEIIRVSESNTWASSIGENNVYCHMYYGDGPDPLGHVLHELGHCIGLVHEHQRPDRDEYVVVVWDKIYPEYQHNFEIRDNPLFEEEDYPYDYESIMHYHSSGFSIDGSDTIEPLDQDELDRYDDMGQREEISEQDAEKAMAIYGPSFED